MSTARESPAPVDQDERVQEGLTIEELCRRYHVNMAHGRYVGRLALELFELTLSLHGLDPYYAETSFYAGLLHNVAFAGGVQGHHTRGRDILLAHPLSDLPDADRALIAVTTVFHRKRWKPKKLKKEPSYTALSPGAQATARWLSALVRIADGLDYSHSQATVIAGMAVTPDGVRIMVAGPYADIDAPRADEKADMWRDVTGIPLRVIRRNWG
jgi:exopolyphosphatase/pppGpp-phosphohydrolase